jgi:hypothetical protein
MSGWFSKAVVELLRREREEACPKVWGRVGESPLSKRDILVDELDGMKRVESRVLNMSDQNPGYGSVSREIWFLVGVGSCQGGPRGAQDHTFSVDWSVLQRLIQ